MHRIDGPGATADNRFTDGDPAGGVQATMVTDDWANAVQEEVIAVITDPLVTPAIPLDKAVNNQLVTAIKRLIALGYSQATELVSGIAKVATQSQTNAGTDDAAFVTPKKLRFGFAVSLAPNGYITLPSWLGGLIIQWGLTGAIPSNTEITVTFPITYPTAARSVVATNQQAAIVNGAWVSYIDTITTTNFVVGADDVGSTSGTAINVYWIAIGH
ncbi:MULTISPECIES: gp53-like domain-containing protein [Pseudomonas chlororaphis group]|uniref:gp53-like domain-containing protein n=1 Tax=Pseudomonas chlororaphis group TaxID=136842 RepID=UPI002098023C|nr:MULTISPECIES: hypothetical protein [Pseudomonas chlororaphis group]MCO7576160.1 hypothetical protein [Pseudomonas protegens]MCO7581002.1 hypothetical protein [Pseudomonas chlororaphis]MCO7597973.1 hypothetical protein [Pseudomonas chlororaphis]